SLNGVCEMIMLFESFFRLYYSHRNLHSFPTRRSSDLSAVRLINALAFSIQDIFSFNINCALLRRPQLLGQIEVKAVERLSVDIGVACKTDDLERFSLHVIEKSRLQAIVHVIIVEPCIDQIG